MIYGFHQLDFIFCGKRKNKTARLSRLVSGPLLALILFNNDMCVRAARAKRTNSSAEGKPHAIYLFVCPLLQTLHYVERRVLKIYEFVQFSRMQGRHKLTMLHLQ